MILPQMEFFKELVNYMEIKPSHIRKCIIILGATLMCLIGIAVYNYFCDSTLATPIPQPPVTKQLASLPYSFRGKEDSYNFTQSSCFHLKKYPMKWQLPDLRSLIISYGISCRPDAPKNKQQIALGIRGYNQIVYIPLGQKAYLKADTRALGRFVFSEQNSPTSLWIAPELQNGVTAAQVQMKDSDGKIVSTPEEVSSFVIQEGDLPAAPNVLQGWTIGSERVDCSLLAKQKAKWVGQDQFLSRFGGKEYAFTVGRERIEFGEEGARFVCFAKEGDLFFFDNERWQPVKEVSASQGKPLLEVKKVGESAILFTLWNEDGTYKIPLELHRSPEGMAFANPLEIKLVGAKSQKDWLAEYESKRFPLRVDDWVLLKDGHIEKVTKTEQIDAYIEGNLRGEMIVFEGVKRQGRELCLSGVRFNDNKTQYTDVMCPLYKAQNTNSSRGDKKETLHNQRQNRQNKKLNHEDDDDDDDDDIFDDDDDDLIADDDGEDVPDDDHDENPPDTDDAQDDEEGKEDEDFM